ncbi:response regulator [Coraliomargarita sp. SDUM461004]|uniref:Response regulator n=1 Tax=Thalassobacterium sedimentorum TaxID=3041258 RepID=A0ABU1AQ49_9BACT|nr:response regulator [Coraliomargarita sp. SDUM461004]MDQ8195985.1 response regulator [Coraliomargarita sp. SDUM461004]
MNETYNIVLIIEDNEALANMLRRRLIKRGYHVKLAVTGEEGLRSAIESVPSILLLDMNLPGKSGWSIAKELKSTEQTQKIPIIAITAHAMKGDRERALQVGCDHYLIKPIDFDQLICLLEEYLNN